MEEPGRPLQKRKRFDRNKDEERFERDRRGFRREKPKNALEKEYRKPFGERFKKSERKPSVFGDSKVDRNIKFKKPTLFSAEEYNKEGEITMRHRKEITLKKTIKIYSYESYRTTPRLWR